MSQLAPNRPEREMVTAWIDEPLARRLEEAARAAERSKSAELRIALREHLARAEQPEEAR